MLSAIERAAWQAAQARELSLASETKRRLGVVHTPPELARAVVRVSDALLREQLSLRGGVFDPRLLVIDPACGPGAFFAAALALAEERAPLGSLRGLGLDLDHEALAGAAALCAHAAGSELRFAQADLLDGSQLLAAAAAHDGPLLVIANPPWSSARSAASAVSQQLLADFRADADGVRLPERKLGVLADAYVRSFRVCAEAARRSSAGAVVALVSNGSYLDGPVHRGMRAALLRWFDGVSVLDLGGSALLGRSAEQRDENVFGVRPSVAVTWLVRKPAAADGGEARVRYVRWSGSRRDKLDRLACSQPEFAALTPEPPLLRFVPTSRRDRAYAAYPSLAECMPFHREGVQSNRDGVVVDADRERLLERLRAFARGDELPELAPARRALPHYDPVRARAAVAEALARDPDGTRGVSVQAVAYRPFDERYFCPVTPLCHRPRPELARALAFEAAALISVRKDRGDVPWRHAAWATAAVDNCYLSARSSCRARAFPTHTPDGALNLSPQLQEQLAAISGGCVDPRTFPHYALAIASAPIYQQRFDAELRQDYARIPLPRTAAAVEALAAHGRALADLFAAPLIAASGGDDAQGGEVLASALIAASWGDDAQGGEVLASRLAAGSCGDDAQGGEVLASRLVAASALDHARAVRSQGEFASRPLRHSGVAAASSRASPAHDERVSAVAAVHARHWPEPPPGARFRDLSLSAADGGIELADTRIFQLTPSAFELRVGHHRPLHAFIAARAKQPLTRAGLVSVIARAERLAALERALRAIDDAVSRELDWAR
jgi:predicted RNA methylase